MNEKSTVLNIEEITQEVTEIPITIKNYDAGLSKLIFDFKQEAEQIGNEPE